MPKRVMHRSHFVYRKLTDTQRTPQFHFSMISLSLKTCGMREYKEKMSAILWCVIIFLLCLQSTSSNGDIAPVKESSQSNRGVQQDDEGPSRVSNCKISAFKLETIISDFKTSVNCANECTERVRGLIESIGKGNTARRKRPILGYPVGTPGSNAAFLDNCMYQGYHCLQQLSNDQLSDPKLIENPSFQNLRLSAASKGLQGYTACHCGLTLKLWRVFRHDITLKGDIESTNCSDVEICKRLSKHWIGSNGWPCITATTIQDPVPCVNRSPDDGENSKVCACNKGIFADQDRACQAIDWSRNVQQVQTSGSSNVAGNTATGRNGRSQTSTRTTANQQIDGISGLRRLGGGDLDDFHWLQLQIYMQIQAGATTSRIPESSTLHQRQRNSIASFTQPITELLPAAHLSAQDFTPVAIDHSDSFANVESLSGPNEAVELASVENNGKHPREEMISELEGHLSLDELVAKRNRWERGESSRSAHDRSTPSSFTHGRGEQESSYVNRYSTPSSLLHLIPAAFTGTQENVQQGSQSSHTSSQGIQLDGSWSDILHQLGPEPMPDLASLGNSQFNAAFPFENHVEQPDFEDLEFRDDPPLFDENDVDDFFL